MNMWWIIFFLFLGCRSSKERLRYRCYINYVRSKQVNVPTFHSVVFFSGWRLVKLSKISLSTVPWAGECTWNMTTGEQVTGPWLSIRARLVGLYGPDRSFPFGVYQTPSIRVCWLQHGVSIGPRIEAGIAMCFSRNAVPTHVSLARQ